MEPIDQRPNARDVYLTRGCLVWHRLTVPEVVFRPATFEGYGNVRCLIKLDDGRLVYVEPARVYRREEGER